MSHQVVKMIILPSFIDSPRYMMQKCLDPMAIVPSKGQPDFFITMMCNRKWREIRDNLFSDKQASEN